MPIKSPLLDGNLEVYGVVVNGGDVGAFYLFHLHQPDFRKVLHVISHVGDVSSDEARQMRYGFRMFGLIALI